MGDVWLAYLRLLAAAATVADSGDTSPIQPTGEWNADQILALAGGNTGLRDRIRLQGDALCALGGPMLSEAELDILTGEESVRAPAGSCAAGCCTCTPTATTVSGATAPESRRTPGAAGTASGFAPYMSCTGHSQA
jgi:hypothetical protein